MFNLGESEAAGSMKFVLSNFISDYNSFDLERAITLLADQGI